MVLEKTQSSESSRGKAVQHFFFLNLNVFCCTRGYFCLLFLSHSSHAQGLLLFKLANNFLKKLFKDLGNILSLCKSGKIYC